MRQAARRRTAVEAGDALSVLVTFAPAKFPVEGGLSFDGTVSYVLERLDRLVQWSQVEWKTQSLSLAREEVTRARDVFLTTGDEEEAWRLFSEAKYHFAQFERGEPPRTTFVAGPNGELERK